MTAASAEEAMRIAEVLVDSKLAACVQVLPEMQSIYLWKGEVERAREVLVIAKTTMAKFDGLQSQLRAIHSYETPEIIANGDRKSTRLNSSHQIISYAVFCLKKKKT